MGRTSRVIDLYRRLERLETARHTGVPTRIMADHPVEDEEADAALANWRIRVAQCRATVLNGVFYLIEGLEMSESDWTARHITAH